MGKYKMKKETSLLSISAARTIVKALLTDSYSLHDAVQYRWVENWAKVMLFLKSHVQRFTG